MQAMRLGLAARVDEIEVGQAAGPLIARPFVQPQGRAVVRDDVQEKRTAGRRQGVLEHPVEQLPRYPAPLVLGKHAERQDVRRRLAVEAAAGLAHQVAVLRYTGAAGWGCKPYMRGQAAEAATVLPHAPLNCTADSPPMYCHCTADSPPGHTPSGRRALP